DLEAVSPPAGATCMWLNYPSNPTGAVADRDFFDRAVAFARANDLLLCHDAAYAEITFDGYVAPSVLESPGARGVAIEFGSLSKTYNMTGWRVGYAVGSEEAIEALSSLKTNLDSGIFNAVQRAAWVEQRSQCSNLTDLPEGVGAKFHPPAFVATGPGKHQGARDASQCIRGKGRFPESRGRLLLLRPERGPLRGPGRRFPRKLLCMSDRYGSESPLSAT